MAFYRFVRMQEQQEQRTHLYLEGVMEAERPWWDESGNVACPENFRAGMQEAGDGPLMVHVNSPGGDLTAGIAIFELLRQRKGETRCEITFAGSAASLVPCGCQESVISPAGMVMIHNPAMLVMGDEVELEKAQRALGAWKQAAIAAYKERIDKTEDEIAAMMTTETYLNAQAAVDIGLCDRVMDKPEPSAAMHYNRQAVMQAEQAGMARMIQERAQTNEAREREALMQWAQEE